MSARQASPLPSSVTESSHSTASAAARWRRIPRSVLMGFGAASMLFLVLSSVHAEMSDSQRRMTNNLKTAVDKAADLFKQQKFAEAAAELKRAQKILDNLNKKPNADVLKSIDKSYRRMAKAHELLTAKGQTLDPLKALPAAPPPTAKKARPKNEDGEEESDSDNESETEEEEAEEAPEEEPKEERTPRRSTRRSRPREEEQQVSFTKEIAPLLVQHCARCHIDNKRGDYSLESYQVLIEGTSVTPNDADSSSLVQMIESGDMPPKKGGSGDPLPEEDVKRIRDWVAQGAKYDGDDPETNLKEL